ASLRNICFELQFTPLRRLTGIDKVRSVSPLRGKAGTGNSAQLFSIDLITEQETVIYEDEQASQITAIAVAGNDVYLGT
ncbi:unnamed protein product, partial [marine sediment metagenome]